MSERFTFDVFLSHSSEDKPLVRTIAHRLRGDGLRVWFDEWQIRPGDSIPAKIEQGLERSSVLVLCMSGNAFGSEWALLESHTFRFRDPLNKGRRFIPLRLDASPIKGALAQFLYIDWLGHDREQEYAKLLETCRPPANSPVAEVEVPPEQSAENSIRLPYGPAINAYAFRPDGKRALSAADDNTVHLWDLKTGRSLRTLEGHLGNVWTVAWSIDQRHAVSGSYDKTLRLWDVETGRCLRVFEGHMEGVGTAAWSSDGRWVVSGSHDRHLRLWDVETGRCLRTIEGHTGFVSSVAWNGDQRRALSGSYDKTVRLWDLEAGRCLRVIEGHTDSVSSVAWSGDRRRAVSGSYD